MGNSVACCSSKPKLPQKKQNLMSATQGDSDTPKTDNQQPIQFNPDENGKNTITPNGPGQTFSPIFERKSDIKETDRFQEKSLFNLTGDIEIQKKFGFSLVGGKTFEGQMKDDPSNSLSMYQLAKELTTSNKKSMMVHDGDQQGLISSKVNNSQNGSFNKPPIVKPSMKKVQQYNGSSAKKLMQAQDLPITYEEENNKNDSEGDQQQQQSRKDAEPSERTSRYNPKIISVVSQDQSSVQGTHKSNKSKVQVENMKSMASYVSNVTNKSGMMSGFYPRPNDSTGSNIPNRVHYDSVINKHLVPTQNKILDDSILEAQGITSAAKMLLIENNDVDGKKFPPWSETNHEDYNFYLNAPSSFEDADFRYDQDVLKQAHGPIYSMKIKDISNARIFDKSLGSKTLIAQGRVDTCSVISSLIGIASFEEAKRVRFIEDLIYPQRDKEHIVNKLNKYAIKLYFNGTRRYVEVDDTVFFLKLEGQDDRFLGANVKQEKVFWPALIEKAICKLYSGNNMRVHSNPSIECFHLIGWVPETIRMTEISNNLHLWQRLIQNFDEDNILINVGIKDYEQDTDPEALEYQTGCYRDQGTKIVYGHCYAMLNLVEVDKVKCALIKNPWGHTEIKSINPTTHDDILLSQIYQAFKIDPSELNKQGLSIVEWGDLVPFCSTIYLNWNPSVYPYRQTLHSRRQINQGHYNPDSHLWQEEYSVEFYTQYVIKIPPHDEDFEVRVFFERHVDSMKEENMNSLSYKLYSYSGDRIIFPNEPLRTHPYQPRELLSDVFIFEASKEVEIYVLVLLSTPTNPDVKPTLQNQTYNFTLEVFSFIEIDVIELPYRKIRQREIRKGTFETNNSGGNILSPAFLTNPKYLLTVKEKADYHFKVEGPKESSLMLVIIPLGNLDPKSEHLARINFQNFLNHNPGFYFQGFSSFKLTLRPDKYVVLISNQNRKAGEYTLYADSLANQLSYHKVEFDNTSLGEKKFSIDVFPDFVSKNVKELSGEWTKENSKGTSRIQTQDYQNFMKNPGFIMKVGKPCKARFSLASTTYAHDYYETLEEDSERTYTLEPPSLSVAVYELLGDFKFKMILEDDHYAPAAWGFFSNEVNLKPNENGYLVLCLNYEKGYTGQFKLTVNSDEPIETIKDASDMMKLAFTHKMKGFWAKENAGGCMSELTFYKNPSYEIVPSEDCEIYVELTCMEPHPLCISIFESDGKGITEFDANVLNNVVTNAYLTQDMAFLRADFERGKTYLLIPSTFRPGQHGRFELHIESQEKLDIYEKKLALYKNKKIFSGEWNYDTNKGPLGSNDFMKNPHVMVKATQETQLRAHLYTVDTTTSIAIHMYELLDGKAPKLVKDSGSYTNMRMGCFVEKTLSPQSRGYLLILSNFEVEKSCEFFIELSSSKTDDIEISRNF